MKSRSREEKPAAAPPFAAASQSAAASPHGVDRTLDERRRHEGQERLLVQGHSSITPSIAEALVIKDGAAFFLCERDGGVPMDGPHGLGLYYHDCRYLSGYELWLGDTKLVPLASTAGLGSSALLESTNADLWSTDRRLIVKDQLGIRWVHHADQRPPALHDTVTLNNYGLQAAEVLLTVRFAADFADVFEVRGMVAKHKGTLKQPEWRDHVLHFEYEGADGVSRGLTVTCDPRPQRTDGTSARFAVKLHPGRPEEIAISLAVSEGRHRSALTARRPARPDLRRLWKQREDESQEWVRRKTRVSANRMSFERILDRSLRDLHMLGTQLGGDEYFAAGVPWYVALFGRDSLVTSLQSLMFDPHIAEQTLRLLARLQGTRIDQETEEEPGKIIHELRVGEMAGTREIPQTPYYGSIDSTPLFLLLVAEHARWTGDLGLFDELRPQVDAALEWIRRYGDVDGDGYIEYQRSSSGGLENQGWKDSGDAISNVDGSLARAPIALVEVQGYVYAAKLGLAGLYERAGERETAVALRREAGELRDRFNKDFWCDDRKFFAVALEEGKRQVATVTSNPGQALWTGIVDEKRAAAVCDRLMASDMFSGWGIRTLSMKERRYNPIGYHLGTVWPHDNALIAAGLKRYGFDQAVSNIVEGLQAAAPYFDLYRLPEVFAGFSRERYPVPVHYPVACHPQAWAAGTMPFLVRVFLGLEPAAFDRRLDITRPVLPPFLDSLEVRGLRVGRAETDLRFERVATKTTVKVLDVRGELDVLV